MKKVLILGGGYAGIYALKELIKQKDIQITLVDKHTYHNLQPQVYDFIANKADMADVTIDLETLCAGFDHPNLQFLNKRIVQCNFQNNEVVCSDGESLAYDQILLAMGSRTYFPSVVQGLNNTDDIKKLHRALYFKQRFEEDMFQKIAHKIKSCEDSHIVIVGAGLSGVEIATEMAHFSAKFFKHGQFACDNMTITLVSGSQQILPGVSKKLKDTATKRIEQLGINLICNEHMQSCDEEFITLSSGKKCRYSFIIFAGGIEAANLTTTFDVEKNAKGQIVVDPYLKVAPYDNVFAAGDVAVIKDKNSQQMPPNVTIARHSAKTAAKNILAQINSNSLSVCDPMIEGTLLALGGRYGACNLYDKINVSGPLGYLIKQYVFYRYKLPLQKISQRGYKRLQRCK